MKILNNNQKNWLYGHSDEADKIINFLNANRINGNVSAEVVNFSILAVEALMNGGRIYWVNKIINNLTNPCADAIFTQLENGIFTQDPLKPEITILTEPVNLNFSGSILKLFNESRSTNLIIENRDIVNNANAHTIGVTITLDNSYIESATQLSIARSIIHEIVHAYINALYSNVVEFKSYTFRQKVEKYASDNGYVIGSNRFHHEFMGQFVEAIAYSLYEWDRDYGTGGHLGWNYYKSMAFAGFGYAIKDSNGNFVLDSNGNKVYEDTDSFKELVPNSTDRDNIKKIISDEAEGNANAKGNKC